VHDLSLTPLSIEIEAAPELSLAMIENSVPLVPRVSLTNNGPHALENLTVEVALLPDFSAKWTAHVSAIPPGGTFHVDELELPLDREKLVNQLERGGADLMLWVRAPGQATPLATASKRIAVLAYNEWSPLTVPQLLAAFVLPNHPVVAELLARAREPLARLTGDPALNSYQSKDPARVTAIAQAIYEAIQTSGITYSNPPASFEKVGQKIRTPEQVLTEEVATCLDVTVLVAACLEQAGLHPLVVLVEGHAFPAVWLEDFYLPEAVLDDGAQLRKLIELGRVLAFDSSAAVTRPEVSMAEARRVAMRELETSSLVFAVDVQGARKQRYRPLPVRVAGTYASVVEVQVAAPASGPSAIPRVSTPEGSGRSRPSAKTKHPRVELWKQRLLDTSLRNKLLNFRDTKLSLDLLCGDLAAVEDTLAAGEAVHLRGRPPLLGGDDPRSKKLLEARVAGDALSTFLGERLAHGELYSEHTSDQVAGKLTAIFRAAREALEETGTNTLCLTLGMLHWYESDSSELPRRAPILLLPVVLHRHARSGGFTLQTTGEDARLNVTLFEKLRLDTGITLPELAELPLDQTGVDVTAVLQLVRNAIVNLRRWEVKEELHLGLFSFAKFQMWADLDQNLDALLANPVITHLLNGKGDPYPNEGAFPEPSELDATLAPQDLLCPLDADASQLAAVAAGADGKTFVLQGPPGTGKSQTITNLITHCIAQGKRVLFVAEKAAALEVVQRRLAQVGLGPYVLELHSHKSGKQQVLDQFRAALEAAPATPPATWDADTRKLAAERAHLNRYVAALHQPRTGGISVFRALSRLDGLRDAATYEVPARCAESPEDFDRLKAVVEDLRHAASALAPIAQSPWHGCRLPAWQLDLPQRVASLVTRALTGVDEARAAAEQLAAALAAGAPVTPADADSLCQVADVLTEAPPHGDALAGAADWTAAERDARALATMTRSRTDALVALRARYQDGLFALDLDALAARFQKLARAFVLFAWWGLRGATKLLRGVAVGGRLPHRTQIADDLEQARTARELEQRLVAQDARGRELYGPSWSAATSDPGALERALAWATRLRQLVAAARPGLLGARVVTAPQLADVATRARTTLAALRATLAELAALLGCTLADDPWPQLRERLERWRDDTARLRDWRAYLTASTALAQAGCAAIVDAVARGELAPDQLPRAFERSAYDAWARAHISNEPILDAFDGDQHQRRVAAFAELDRGHLAASRLVARALVAQRAPTAAAVATGGEMGILQKELQKKRRHMPIRKLLAEIPALAGRLKPCFLMSPMSVATYLDPRAAGFDIVVFDEASQIPTHDAIGVLARGKSAIVVGDSKQLPPTSFFQAGGDDDAPDDNDFVELESILDECVAGGLPERRLDWHYRSRHESLIAFSNFHYYRNRLNTFPSAAAIGAGRGVTLRPIAGYYDKGGARTNQAEAQAVVADLVARLRAPDARSRTYGVVTFSQAQQGLVEDLLDRVRAEQPELEPFFDHDTHPEPVIVKNLENIQGDERDVMIFSVCYGPDQHGKVSMNFGPLNRDGGERRLNVAVTRAREELVVYATLSPDQIDLTRTNAVGVKHLKTFLDYARRGPSAIAEAVAVQAADAFESPFEEQVCERLRALGHTVHTQVGCAGYRLDMGITDPDQPGRYLLAIECDGAYYHSARSARERDRLRAQVLGGLGWRIHRIWSTDWWQAPDRELAKMQAAIERAKTEQAEAPSAPAIVDLPMVPMPDVPARDPWLPPPAPVVVTPAHAARVAEVATQVIARGATAQAVVPYRIAEVPEGRREPDDIYAERHRDELKELLHAVLRVEAPVSLSVLARRILPFYGLKRATTRVEERLRSVLGRSAKIADEIVWRLEQDPATYAEVRLAPSEARREAPEVPLEEVANAAISILRASVALDHDELVKLTARTLGFTRTGERVAEHMASGIASLVKRGGARRDGEKVVLA